MLYSSSFCFRMAKNMSPDGRAHKPTSRYRFRDVSNMKLMGIFKPLRRRRLRRDASQRSSLTYSRSVPLVGYANPVRGRSPDLLISSPVRYRSDVVSILSATEEDCSSGMSPSNVCPDGPPARVERAYHFSPCPFFQTFPTSPSIFQLRSTSTKDYLVDLLEQNLRQLSLGDASPDAGTMNLSSRDTPMDVHLGVSQPGIRDSETSSHRALSDGDKKKPMSSHHDLDVVPLILITSVDAKHAKPLPPSSRRPSRTPFSPSNVINRTNTHLINSEPKTPSDDPFTAQPHGSADPLDHNLTFRLPSFPSGYRTPSKYVPETPTPMCCEHFGDCRGDLWEILHPPLVAGKFTLPPFKLPPMSTGLFDNMYTELPH